MAGASIYTMASGGQAPTFRCYLHAQTDAGSRLLVELLLSQTASTAALTIKAEDASHAPAFAAKVKAVLTSF